MKRLRLGVIGCGMVARVGHLPWFARNPDCEVVALADPDPKNLAAAARKYRVPHTYPDADSLLGSASVDAVSVCSPNWAHAEQVIQAARCGLHVLCEKPLAVSLSDCEQMIRACAEAGVILQVALQKRFHPAFQRAREMIGSGEIGEVFQITVFWNHYVPDLAQPWAARAIRIAKRLGYDAMKKWGAWRLTDPRAGGGDFMDHGPHYLDLFRFLVGDFILISAEMKRVYSSRVHEDHGLCTVRFLNGALGHIERSQDVVSRPYGHERVAIHGTRGSLFLEVPHEYTLGHARLYRYRKRNMILDQPSRVRVPGGRRNASYGRQADLFVARALARNLQQMASALEPSDLRQPTDARSAPNLDSTVHDFPAGWAPTGEDGRIAVESVLAAYLSSFEEKKVSFPLTAQDRKVVEDQLCSQDASQSL